MIVLLDILALAYLQIRCIQYDVIPSFFYVSLELLISVSPLISISLLARGIQVLSEFMITSSFTESKFSYSVTGSLFIEQETNQLVQICTSLFSQLHFPFYQNAGQLQSWSQLLWNIQREDTRSALRLQRQRPEEGHGMWIYQVVPLLVKPKLDHGALWGKNIEMFNLIDGKDGSGFQTWFFEVSRVLVLFVKC